MSVNRYLPHVLALPEDDANRQLANGFLLDQYVSTHKIQVLPEVGGWTQVLELFLFRPSLKWIDTAADLWFC